MVSKHSDWKERKDLLIKDVDDFKDKLKVAYKKWQDTGFNDEWIRNFKNSWNPSSNVWDFIKLLKAKKELSEVEYKEKEKEMLQKFEDTQKIVQETIIRLKAEQEAFEKAEIDEGRVEYKCPICGGIAVANRYKHSGRYHGLGSGCKTCGVSHS